MSSNDSVVLGCDDLPEDIPPRGKKSAYKILLAKLSLGRKSKKTNFTIPFLKGVDLNDIEVLRDKGSKFVERENSVIDSIKECFHIHRDYVLLAGRFVSWRNMTLIPRRFFSNAIRTYHQSVITKHGKVESMTRGISRKLLQTVNTLETRLNSIPDPVRELSYTYTTAKNFIDKTCMRLLNDSNSCVEQIQYVFLRTAITLTDNPLENLQRIEEVYMQLSSGEILLPVNVLRNAGKATANLASGFKMKLEESSQGLSTAMSSLSSLIAMDGRIDVGLPSVKSKAVRVTDTLELIEKTCDTFTDLNSNESKTSTQLQIWHSEFRSWINSSMLNNENSSISISIPDLFYRREEDDEKWSFFLDTDYEELYSVYGDEFKTCYERMERDADVKRISIPARDLMDDIINAVKRGRVTVINRDPVNERNNMRQLGVVNSGGVNSDNFQFCDEDEIAISNRGVVSLDSCVKEMVPVDGRWIDKIDFEKLVYLSGSLCKMLNVLIDEQNYAFDNKSFVRKFKPGQDQVFSFSKITGQKFTKFHNVLSYGNTIHRPISIGLHAFQDLLLKLKISYDSPTAVQVMRRVQEGLYFGAVKTSIDLAEIHGPYQSCQGISPHRIGLLQFDYVQEFDRRKHLSHELYDWTPVLDRLKIWKMRNSVLTGQGPDEDVMRVSDTIASFDVLHNLNDVVTSSDLTTGKEVVRFNAHFQHEMERLGIWTPELYEILSKTSDNETIKRVLMQYGVPNHVMNLFKTRRDVDNHQFFIAAAMQPYLDQGVAIRYHGRSDYSCAKDKTQSDVDEIHRLLTASYKLRMKNGLYSFGD